MNTNAAHPAPRPDLDAETYGLELVVEAVRQLDELLGIKGDGLAETADRSGGHPPSPHELAFAAVRAALITACDPGAGSFSVVLGHASDPQNRFTVKSASDASLAGLKAGSYFPTNDVAGLPQHDSLILLFDQATGRIGAIVEAGKLNAYRTAAADAVATDTLARPEARVPALFGTGHQASYEAEAVARVRKLERVLVVGRSPERAEATVARLCATGLPAEASDAEPGATCRGDGGRSISWVRSRRQG